METFYMEVIGTNYAPTDEWGNPVIPDDETTIFSGVFTSEEKAKKKGEKIKNENFDQYCEVRVFMKKVSFFPD